MKEVIWKELTLFKKIIFIIGWNRVIAPIFWIAMLVIYYQNNDKYNKFFNPQTYKVPYFFGWLTSVVIVLVILFTIYNLIVYGEVL